MIFSDIHLYYSVQTLTYLNVSGNKFSNEGVKYLSNALKINKVRLIFDPSFSYRFISLNIDTHYITSRSQRNR